MGYSIEADEKELVIVEDVEHEADPETVSQGTPDMNIADENDEIADTADDAETQENNIDQPVINIISSEIPAATTSSPQEIATNRLSYAMGLQHKQAEFQSLLSLQNQKHEQEKVRFKQRIVELEKMVQIAFNKGLQEGLNNATGPILATLFQLNPNIFPKNTKLVNLRKNK